MSGQLPSVRVSLIRASSVAIACAITVLGGCTEGTPPPGGVIPQGEAGVPDADTLEVAPTDDATDDTDLGTPDHDIADMGSPDEGVDPDTHTDADAPAILDRGRDAMSDPIVDAIAEVGTTDLDMGPTDAPSGDADVEPDLPPPCVSSSPLVINELIASNLSVLYDEDGDTPDWIEFYNPSPEPVDLAGFGLSDDEDEPYEWYMPAITIDPGGFLLVFASGKDRNDYFASWDTLIDWGDNWRYHEPSGEVPDWRQPGFDDSSWPVGPSGFGRADGDDATALTEHTVYIRRAVDLSADEIADAAALYMHIDYDDGFVAYVNGVEVARRNLSGTPPAWNDLTTMGHEATMYTGGAPESFPIEDGLELLTEGPNTFALEVHDATSDSSDLTLIPFVSLGYNTTQPDAVPSIWLPTSSALHTNFKLSAQGDQVILTDAEGCTVDALSYVDLHANESYGRQTDGSDTFGVFLEPTPDASNTTESRLGFAETPRFDPPAGIYTDGVDVTLTVDSPTAVIRYTRDGTEPSETSPIYTGDPISVSPGPGGIGSREAIPIRARAWDEAWWPSRIGTGTYVLRDPVAEMPIISVVTDPRFLWDPTIGIYINYWDSIEHPAHVELWEPDGSLAFDLDCGLMIHGGASRDFDMKSLRLVMRAGYGAPVIDYEIFPGNERTEFERLIMRNGGHDWLAGHLRDPLIHTITAQADVDTMAYRPAVAYLNGEYWGIYNLRERPDEFTAAGHHEGVDPDAIDLLEFSGGVVEGTDTHYFAMLDFLRTADTTAPETWEYIQTQMDVEEFADYQLFQILLGNYDWPGNNIKFWRPQADDGRWRWQMYDTDAGIGNWGITWSYDFLDFALEPFGQVGAPPSWSTEPLRLMLAIPKFERLFINRYADFLNTYLLAENTHAILTELAAVIEPEITAHMSRWGSSYGSWSGSVDSFYAWLEDRPGYAWDQVRAYFGLQRRYNLSLDTDPPGAASFELTAVTVEPPFEGSYFPSVPFEVTVHPVPGYELVGWSLPELGDALTIEVDGESGGSVSLVAIFEVEPGIGVMINEINYNSTDEIDPEEWIELYNQGPETDLSGWSLHTEDEGVSFVLPPGTVLPSDGYLVLANDASQFRSVFPSVEAVVGDFPFPLSNGGETITFRRPDGTEHDSVDYDDESPWPTQPDGGGPTLELIDPGLDNAEADSWRASPLPFGTPGAQNTPIPGD